MKKTLCLWLLFLVGMQYSWAESNQNVILRSENNPNRTFRSLSINGKKLVYDETSDTYFCTLPEGVRHGQTVDLNLQYQLQAGFERYTVQLDGASRALGDNRYRLQPYGGNQRYEVSMSNPEGTEVKRVALQFTYLPMVEISLDSCTPDFYTRGTIRVVDANSEGTDSVYNAKFKYRGNTSLRYDKKSFNIKLTDANGKSIDRTFCGLRTDNRWILDAMTIDPSCMRNRVGMDLWNSYATPPYYANLETGVLTGTQGRFVEVFWNGKYHGLFCLSERLDRKQLQLKKFVSAKKSPQGRSEIHGLLYKGKEWSYEVLMGHEPNDPFLSGRAPQPYANKLGVETWCSYDMKYPDYEKEAVEWNPLYECVNFVATSDQETFDAKIKNYLDFPVLIDYYLLLEIMTATDNHGKNMFYFAYDYASADGRKLSVAPWDLDATFGLDWQGYEGNVSATESIHDRLMRTCGGNNTYYLKLMQSKTIDWKVLLAERYAQLRANEFSNDALLARFRNYANLFAESQADQREQEKWGGLHSNIQRGVDFACSWLEEHIKSLDEQYGYEPKPDGIGQTASDSGMRIVGEVNALTIYSAEHQVVKVYNLSGKLLNVLDIHEGENHIGGLDTGIYYVGGQKVMVR